MLFVTDDLWDTTKGSDSLKLNSYVTSYNFLSKAMAVIYLGRLYSNGLSLITAGLPTASEFSGTSFVTTLFAPTYESRPIDIGPNTHAPVKTATPSCNVGPLYLYIHLLSFHFPPMSPLDK